MKKIITFFIIGQIISSIITYIACYFLDYSTLRDAVDVSFFVGAAIVYIGFQASQSSGSEDAMIYLSTRYTDDGRESYNSNEQDSVQSGINFGWFVVITGLAWVFISYGIYYIFGRTII